MIQAFCDIISLLLLKTQVINYTDHIQYIPNNGRSSLHYWASLNYAFGS